MHPRDETIKFGMVAVFGVAIYVVGIVLFEPTAVGGGTGTTEYFEPLRAIGGALVIAAIAGWIVTRFQSNHQ